MIHTLTKDQGPAELNGVTHLMIGVSWDPSSGSDRGVLGWARKKVGMDLDLVAFAMVDSSVGRLVGLDSLDPLSGALVHSGDNQTGAGAGDDETVTVDFARIPSHVTSIVFVAAAFKKRTSFGGARNISFKIYDATGGSVTQVADIWPDLLSTANANAVARATRRGSEWVLEVLNETGNVNQGDETSLAQFAKRHSSK
jgi:stress response protein SCP2